MTHDLVILVLDAFDPTLLHSWAEAGRLPTFRRLLAESRTYATKNPPGLYVGAVWPSLFTGTSPAKHGRYCYRQLVPGSYRVEPFPHDAYRAPPFWNAVAKAGRRVALVDVPKGPPPDGSAALHVADWGTHDPERAGFVTHPAALAEEIVARYGRDPVGICDGYAPDEAGARSLVAALHERIRRKTSLSLDLLGRESWDLFLTVFTESHCAAHQLWRWHDREHPDHDAEAATRLGDLLLVVYTALDAAIGTLVGALDSRTRLLVVTSHGASPHYDACALLPELLWRVQGRSSAKRWVEAAERIWQALPGPVRGGLRSRVSRVRSDTNARRALSGWSTAEALSAPDPSELRYFAIPNNDAHGAIRFNLVGREPRGKMTKTEIPGVLAEIRDGLASFVNGETGEPILAGIEAIETLYPGEDTGALPDLIVDWNRRSRIRRVESPRFGRVERETPGSRSGDHSDAGLVLARTPGLAPGRGHAIASVDLAATVCAMLGVAADGLDGRPVPELARAIREG